ncbi:MAG TPA: hypothetical protein PK760_11380, partial [Flavobacteriales bacterium]|nr:hypothetical protein [Flavobacteriales bacterium]
MRSLSFAVFLLASFGSSACMNMMQRVPGVEYEHVEFYWIGRTTVDEDSVRAFIRQAEEKKLKDGREWNDVAIAHLYLKEYDAGLKITTKLVAKHPKDYSIVITHAAALELNG